MMKATHALSLYVHTGTPEQFEQVHEVFSETLAAMGSGFPYAGMSSMLLDDEPVEEDCDHYFKDASTLEKVKAALGRVLVSDQREQYMSDIVNAAVEEMKKEGIVFLERR